MRKIKKYNKSKASKNQQEKLNQLNKFQDDIAYYFYNNKNKTRTKNK